MTATLQVLIADHDAKTRFLMRQALVGGRNLGVAEVDSGLATLERLSDSSFGLLVLDVDLPHLSGLEILEVIRSEAKLQALPVVMTGAEIERAAMHRILELGVADLIVKPFHPARLASRLGKVIDRIMAASVSRPADAVSVREGASVLVVDGSPAFRQFLFTAMGDRLTGGGVATGTEALRVCADLRPEVVLIGEDTGLLRGVLLAQKIRALPGCEATTVIAVIPADADPNAAEDRAFHAVVLRSHDADALRKRLEFVLGQQALSNKLREDLPALHRHLFATVQESFEIMLGCRARVSGTQEKGGSHREAVDICIPKAAEALRCTLSAEPQGLTSLGRWLGLPEAAQSPDGQGDQLGEYLNMLAGGLRNWLVDRGYECENHFGPTEPLARVVGSPIRVLLERGDESVILVVELSHEQTA